MTFARAARRARETFDDFVHSKLYIALIAAVAFVLWKGENLLAAIAVLGVIGGLVLALVRDMVPMVPFVAMAPCVVHVDEMPAQDRQGYDQLAAHGVAPFGDDRGRVVLPGC